MKAVERLYTRLYPAEKALDEQIKILLDEGILKVKVEHSEAAGSVIAGVLEFMAEKHLPKEIKTRPNRIHGPGIHNNIRIEPLDVGNLLKATCLKSLGQLAESYPLECAEELVFYSLDASLRGDIGIVEKFNATLLKDNVVGIQRAHKGDELMDIMSTIGAVAHGWRHHYNAHYDDVSEMVDSLVAITTNLRGEVLEAALEAPYHISRAHSSYLFNSPYDSTAISRTIRLVSDSAERINGLPYSDHVKATAVRLFAVAGYSCYSENNAKRIPECLLNEHVARIIENYQDDEDAMRWALKPVSTDAKYGHYPSIESHAKKVCDPITIDLAKKYRGDLRTWIIQNIWETKSGNSTEIAKVFQDTQMVELLPKFADGKYGLPSHYCEGCVGYIWMPNKPSTHIVRYLTRAAESGREDELRRLIGLFSQEDTLNRALEEHPSNYGTFFENLVGYYKGKGPELLAPNKSKGR